MKSNLALYVSFLLAGIMISELIQSESPTAQGLGEAFTLACAVSSLTHYLVFRKIEDLTRNREKFVQRGALLFGNSITLITAGISLFSRGTEFGLLVIFLAIFLGYEGWRTKNGYKFFIPVRKKK